MTPLIQRERLNRRIRIERPAPATGLRGAGKATWELVDTVWAEVQDALPSRGERLTNGITSTARPARVRMRYREGITSDMRIVMGDRVMQIIGMPAELGRRDGLEFMVEDYRPAGAAG